jgi:N-acetylmuramoyl-L-alanine amidase
MPKVFLSAGHGGSDPGAVANGLYEKTINLNTLLACQAELVRHGVTVTCSRTTDTEDPVQREVIEANASDADLAVSFHANAGGGDGFEVFYYTENVEAAKLAKLCENHVKALGQNSRGLKRGNGLYFIKNTKMTSVLVESFFVDNKNDAKIGDTILEQKAFGVAYAKAILEYLDIPYQEKTAKDAVYRVQVGAFKSKDNAEKRLKNLKKAGYDAVIVKE